MNATSPSVADKVAIHELLARYAWSFGTGDVDSFVSCFAPDAVLCEDAFEEEDRWTGQAEIRDMAEFFFSRPGFPGRQHHVTNILITGNNKRCLVRAFCFVTLCAGEPPFTVRFAGYYEDVVVKLDGNWFFQERIIRDWSGPILKNFPGQDGVKKPRQRPAELVPVRPRKRNKSAS